MEKIKSKSTALVLIDVQKGFDSNYWGVRNNLDAEKKYAAFAFALAKKENANSSRKACFDRARIAIATQSRWQ
ncbi:MAG: hypothetical protein SFY67_16010 [Candidatus Melainabacteria bacterium]|nr:hypothetical protein [Candidatus Melainabacteria bacterium]